MAYYDTASGLPGAKTKRTASHRRVLLSEQGKVCVAGILTINGTTGADAGNTGNVRNIRAGKVMGRITSTGEWAPSIIGVSGEAMAAAETEMTVAEAVGDEIERRIGASGTFKLTGPPTAGGTVRTVTVTYSAIAAAGGGNRAITMTAMDTAAVWTLTNASGTDGGTFRLKVTLPSGVSATTTALNWNDTGATIDTALEALDNIGASEVAATGNAGGPWTLTFISDLGDVTVDVVNDLTADGGVYEGGIDVVHTATGVDGRFVTASYIQPTDGSETLRLLVGDGYGIRCVDADGVSEDQEWQQHAEALCGGYVDSSQIIDISSDTALLEWTKDELRNVGNWIFDDDVA